MESFSYDSVNQFDFARSLASRLLAWMREKRTIALRLDSNGDPFPSDEALALSAIVAVVQPAINLIYNAHAQCLEEMSASSITSHLVRAYTRGRPVQDESEATDELVSTLASLAMTAAVKRILVASHPDLSEEAKSRPIQFLVASSILERVDILAPRKNVVKLVVKLSGKPELYFLTSGGSVLVRRSEDEDLYELDEDKAPNWSELEPYKVTASDIESARSLIAAGRIKKKTTREGAGVKWVLVAPDGSEHPDTPERMRELMADPDPEGTGQRFRIAKAGFSRADQGSIVGSVKKVSAETVDLQKQSGEQEVVGVKSIHKLSSPERPFVLLTMEDTLMDEARAVLSEMIAPAFKYAGDASRVEGLVSRLVREVASTSGDRAPKPGTRA